MQPKGGFKGVARHIVDGPLGTLLPEVPAPHGAGPGRVHGRRRRRQVVQRGANKARQNHRSRKEKGKQKSSTKGKRQDAPGPLPSH
eukprot:7405193-Prorocentrum_lima.AAC.1